MVLMGAGKEYRYMMIDNVNFRGCKIELMGVKLLDDSMYYLQE